MMNTVFTSLIINAALLISLIPFYSLIRRLTKDNTINSILIGVIFGGAAVAGMNLPFQYIPGIIYDGRSIILSLTGLFGGYSAGIVSILIAGIYRSYLSGNGVWAGVATIVLCTLAGVVFRRWLKGKPEDVSVFALYIFGVSAHIIMLACQMLLIPFPRGIEVIGKIWLPVIVVFPVATVIMGLFLREEEARIKAEDARQRAEEEITKLNEELKIKSQRLEGIIEATDIGTWEWNIKTGETVFNERWAEMVGYTLSEISPTSFDTWARLVHPDDLIKSNEELEKHFRGETDIYECECRLKHRDGYWVWILDRGKVIKWDEDGRPLIMFGSHLDITERKMMEEMIREGERFLLTIINNLPGFVYRCLNDENWTMEYLSEQVETITGYKVDEIIDNRVISYNNIIHSDYRESVKRWVDEALEKKSYFELYYPVITKSGETRWVWEKGRGVYDDGGSLRYLEGFITDITEAKLKEQAYLESESKLVAITEAAQDAIVMIDNFGKVTFWNPAAERMFGYSEKEMIGRDVHEILALNDQNEVFEKMFSGFLETGEGPVAGRTMELVALSRTDEEIPVELSLSAVKIKGDWHAIAIIRDITERKRAEEEKKRLEMQFLQAQKLESIGRLAGGVAHDFNNILSVIIGYGEIILARLSYDDPLREYITQIVDAGKRAAGLTNQLLAFSRKQILRPGSIDLNELLKNTEKMLRRLIGEDIELILKLSDDLPNIYADSVQIEQVILNLAVNARDAMPQGGRLTIETSVTEIDEKYGEIPLWFKPGKYVLLTVSDTGVGINEKDIDNIFEPFFTTKETGTGLGLATVYGIVKQSGGNIVVDSKEGSGTSFKVYLPIAEKTDGMDSAKEKRDTPQEVKGQHILVVEDEEMVRDLLSIALTDKGFSVTVAKNAEEALKILKGQGFKPDLLITDIVMPGMSGTALAEHLKKTMPDMKIVYMSGYTDDTIVRHGVTDSKIPLIQKPFNMGEFISQIQKLLSDGEK